MVIPKIGVGREIEIVKIACQSRTQTEREVGLEMSDLKVFLEDNLKGSIIIQCPHHRIRESTWNGEKKPQPKAF